MVKSIFIGLLLLAAVEATAFIAVGREIGMGFTLLLTLALSVAGVFVLKWAGRAQIEKVRQAMKERTPIALESADVMLVAAGILLLIPGFVTDLIGLALLMPPLRRRVAGIGGRLVKRGSARRPGAVIELERDQWRQVRDDEVEDRRRRR